MEAAAAEPLCSCSSKELLRDIPGSVLDDICPLCASGGVPVPIRAHPKHAKRGRHGKGSGRVRPAPPVADSPFDAHAWPSSPTAQSQPNGSAADDSPTSASDSSGLPAAPPVPPDGHVANFVSSNGCIYTGDMVGGCAEGRGTIVTPVGMRYEGEWVRNQKHGYGTKWCVDGTVHEGYWAYDQRHGAGRTMDANGRVILEGVWHDGSFLPPGAPPPPSLASVDTHAPRCVHPDGHSYTQEWGCQFLGFWFTLPWRCCGLAPYGSVCTRCGHRIEY